MTLTNAYELPQLDRRSLQANGWAECFFPHAVPATFEKQLIALAMQLGTPVATRTGGKLCDELKPTESHASPASSLSRLHSLGKFPLHVDTAHWITPCRWIILACLSSGEGRRQTLLMDVEQLPLEKQEISQLRTIPFRVVNGRNCFFSTILSEQRRFVRYDPGCMRPVTPNGDYVLSILSCNRWADYVENVDWQEGKVVVLDNWRMLHGRGDAVSADPNRILLRVSIK